MSGNSNFLRLPEDFDASLHYYRSDEKPVPCAINITNIAMAHFSPGYRGDTFSTLVRADGSDARLYYHPDFDSGFSAEGRDDSSRGQAHHRALVAAIESRTGQKLVEAGSDDTHCGKDLTNVNPAHILGFQQSTDSLSLFIKGLSREFDVDDRSAHATLMTNVAGASQDFLPIHFETWGYASTLTVSKASINAVWQKLGHMYLSFDGMQEPVSVMVSSNDQKATSHILDEIVASSAGALRGARLQPDDSVMANAFYARPGNVGEIGLDSSVVKVAFTNSAGIKTESDRNLQFLVRGGKDRAQAAQDLLIRAFT